VEDERDGIRVLGHVVVGQLDPAECEAPRGGCLLDLKLEHVDPEIGRDVARRCVERRAHDDGAGVQIAKIELELGRPIGRVERRARGGRRDGEECRRGLGPVLDDESDPVGRPDPRTPEPARYRA
jgi:hypothetical protein